MSREQEVTIVVGSTAVAPSNAEFVKKSLLFMLKNLFSYCFDVKFHMVVCETLEFSMDFKCRGLFLNSEGFCLKISDFNINHFSTA